MVDSENVRWGLAAAGQDEEHPRRRIQAGVEAGQHGGEDDRIHDRRGIRDPDDFEGTDVRRLAQLSRVPRQNHGQQEDRPDEEERDTPDDRPGGLGDGAFRVVRFGTCDRRDLRSNHGEDDDNDARQQDGRSVREESSALGEVAEVQVRSRPSPEDKERPDAEEDENRGDLDAREPVFELTERLDRVEVGRRHEDHEDERQHPQRRVDPIGDDLRTGDGLESNDDDPEVPVEPCHGEAGPRTQSISGVFREGAGARLGDRHLAEHLHHHDDEHPGQGVRYEGARTGLVDDHAGPDEQAGSDDTTDRDHRQVSLFQSLMQACRGHRSSGESGPTQAWDTRSIGTVDPLRTWTFCPAGGHFIRHNVHLTGLVRARSRTVRIADGSGSGGPGLLDVLTSPPRPRGGQWTESPTQPRRWKIAARMPMPVLRSVRVCSSICV